MGCLYKLTFPSGKAYIGITMKSFDERWALHLKQTKDGRRQALHSAILKYGKESVVCKTLVISDSKDYLHDLEIKAINMFNTIAPNGYNLTTGGEGIKGLTEASRKKMSESMKKTWKVTKTGRLPHLANMRDMKRKAMLAPGAEQARREKISQSMKIRSSTAEAKKRLAEISLAVWNDPEKRAALLAKRKSIIDAKKEF